MTTHPTSPTPANQPLKSQPAEISAFLDIGVDEILTIFAIKRELVSAPAGGCLDKKLKALHQAVTEFYDELAKSASSPQIGPAGSSTSEDEEESDYEVDDDLIVAYIEHEAERLQPSGNPRNTTPASLPSSTHTVSPPAAPTPASASTPTSSDGLPPYSAHTTSGAAIPVTTAGATSSSPYFILFSALSGQESPYYPAPNYTMATSSESRAKWIAIYKGTSVGVIYNWDNAKAFVQGIRYASYKGFATCMEACHAFWTRHADGRVEVLARSSS